MKGDEHAAVFRRHQCYLFAVAYRMLGAAPPPPRGPPRRHAT